MKSRNFGFSPIDKKSLPEGVFEGYMFRRESLVVARIEEPLLDQFRGVYTDMDSDVGVARVLQMHFDCQFLLLAWDEQEEVRVSFFSSQRRVRALEFMDYLMSDFGLAKGNAQWANGRVSAAILNVQMSSLELKSTMEYLLCTCMKYFEDCDWIEAENYIQREEDLQSFCRYQKHRNGWAFVKTLDLVDEGEQIRLKSLENESGMVITAGASTYIMIGCRGEIYDISKDKFESTYEMTEETLDVFEQMLDFLPEVQLLRDNSYVALDEFAHMCYPKNNSGIYAKELDKRTKVFPVDEKQEYYLGREGDYIAIRADDFQDVYIIQRDIFRQTYEESEL